MKKTKIFVISMTAATERRARFEARAQGSLIEWSFFDAATELICDIEFNQTEVEKYLGRQMGRGEIGCYVSHYRLWQQLHADFDSDQYIILEDDVIVDWSALSKIAQVDLQDYGIFYLRLFAKFPESFIVRRKSFLWNDRTLIEFIGRPFGTQGYVITKAAAQKWLTALNTIRYPIDYSMDRSWDHGVGNFAIYPFPIIEEAIASSIGSDRHIDDRSLSRQAARRRFRDVRRGKIEYYSQLIKASGNNIKFKLLNSWRKNK